MLKVGIPLQIEQVFHEFRAAEFSTLTKDNTPIAWPVLMLYQPEQELFLTTTSIGLSQKAINIRRNPRVALLFSDPKASGLSQPPAVLVQGDAVSKDEIVTTKGIEGWYEKDFRVQPSSQKLIASGSAFNRRLMDWYYMRLAITIKPRQISWWVNGDFTRTPEVIYVG